MTIFSKIIKGKIPAYKIAETDRVLAFLDAFPIGEGHVLIIPKIEIDKVFDLDDDLLAEMVIFAKIIGKALEAAFTCDRCGLAILGLEISHAHIHLLPLKQASDMDFSKPRLELSETQFKNIQGQIIKALDF